MYTDVVQALRGKNSKIQSCFESLGYVADGVVCYGLFSILIGCWTREYLVLLTKLVNDFKMTKKYNQGFSMR